MKDGIEMMPGNEETPPSRLNVHRSHCCVIHGCKYGDDENCPVVTKKYGQVHPCMDCEEENEQEGRMSKNLLIALEVKIKRESQKIKDNARYSGFGQNSANNILAEFGHYKAGFYKTIPKNYYEHIRDIKNEQDPEYKQYLRLKEKFE